jgi:hypothetical protein
VNITSRPIVAKSAEDFLVYSSLLPSIREKYGPSFDFLEIPEVLGFDAQASQFGIVCVRYYDGKTYNWSEENGGAGLGTELSLEMVRLVQDFRRIDIAWLVQHPAGSWMREFDLQAWLRQFRNNKARGLELGISGEEIARAEELIGAGFDLNDQIFGNGDFYPRNLVKLSQNTVVIDWEYRRGFRACFLDYLPNVLAFAFVHMFNNDPWLAEFIRCSRDAFQVGTDDLRRAIMIKAFEQGSFWYDCKRPDLFPHQTKLFRMALNHQLPI